MNIGPLCDQNRSQTQSPGREYTHGLRTCNDCCQISSNVVKKFFNFAGRLSLTTLVTPADEAYNSDCYETWKGSKSTQASRLAEPLRIKKISSQNKVNISDITTRPPWLKCHLNQALYGRGTPLKLETKVRFIKHRPPVIAIVQILLYPCCRQLALNNWNIGEISPLVQVF